MTTWTKIQPLRRVGEANVTGFCPTAEANVNTNTMGKMTMPGEVVRYPRKKMKNTTMATNARRDSEYWMLAQERCPIRAVYSARETKWKIRPNPTAGSTTRASRLPL